MDEDPYAILGVARTATTTEIKKAYRKLALKFHPDKLPNGASDREKEAAEEKFTKISNAYQILGDEEARRKFDNGGMNQSFNGFDRGSYGGQHNFHDFAFTNPFDFFNEVFGEEFSMHRQFHGQSNRSRGGRRMRDPFDDPFFNNHGSMFGGGGFGMMDQMNNMMQMQMNQGFGNGGGGGFTSSFSSSSTSYGGSGGVSESVSTKTQVIDGQRQTITERVKVHPDGRVERHVETSGGSHQQLQNDQNDNGRGLMQRLRPW